MKSPTPKDPAHTHTHTCTYVWWDYDLFRICLGQLRAISHTSQQMWPCNCEGLWVSCKGRTMRNGKAICVETDTDYRNLRHTYLLEIGMTQILANRENITHSLPCRNPCRVFIHDKCFGPLGHNLLVWSELGRSRPFRLKRDLRMQWSHAFRVWSGH